MDSTGERLLSVSDKVLDDGELCESLRTLREHGFTHIHFSQGWRAAEPLPAEEVVLWQEALAAADVRVLDVHGCHPKGVNLWEEDPEAREKAIRLCADRLRLTKELGGDAMVYHVPAHCEPTPAVIERFLDALARLEETARELGVKIALENHYLAENDRIALSAAYERFDADYLGFTFDTGHAIRSGNTEWLIANAFDRLTILHLHDNEPGHDRHWLPWAEGGHVDWRRVAEAIAESPYRKPLQFEIQWKKEEYPDHGLFLREAYRRAVKLDAAVAELRSTSR